MEGGETPVDKALLEVAGEALGHLVRNCVVHAIEDPAIRRRRGKLSEGRISLCATVHGGEVRVTVQDDGAGIDPEALLEKARTLGMDTAGIESPFSLLFLPSFSTRSAVDLSSGRGMGLSSVQEAVLRLGGSVEVSSEKGEGTRFRLRLPLCVSVMRALLLRADGEEYAVPMLSVVETVQLLPGDGHEINHAGILKWRGGMVPLLDLGRLFGTTGSSRDRGFVVILDVDQRRRGLVGDEISGIQEIVVKELDPLVGKTAGVFGATVLGDGRVILILDPKALISLKPRVGGGAPPREVGP
jgi:two-component system chemotaxis sensor kinase CheA